VKLSCGFTGNHDPCPAEACFFRSDADALNSGVEMRGNMNRCMSLIKKHNHPGSLRATMLPALGQRDWITCQNLLAIQARGWQRCNDAGFPDAYFEIPQLAF
jgi:hypothetical protein